MARIPVIPATHVLTQVSAKGGHIAYLRGRHGMGCFYEHLVTLTEKRRNRDIGKLGQSAYLQSTPVLPDVIETRNRLNIDEGFRIVKQALSL
jgi:hypothetical protein